MKLSREGQQLIERFEGRRNTAYLDSANLWTIGIGHLIRPDEQWMRTATLTDQQVDELFRQDVAWAEQAVQRLFPKVRHQSQFDALVSFVFNLGEGATQRGTLDDLINSGAPPEAISAKWMEYTRAGGQVVRGLVRRRAAELQHYWSYLWRMAFLLLVFGAAILFTTGLTITA